MAVESGHAFSPKNFWTASGLVPTTVAPGIAASAESPATWSPWACECAAMSRGIGFAVRLGPALERRGDRVGHARAPGSGVDEQRLPVAEDQIEKRLLVVRAARLPEDIEIGVVFMEPEVRLSGRARIRRLGPTFRQRSPLESSAVWLRSLRRYG